MQEKDLKKTICLIKIIGFQWAFVYGQLEISDHINGSHLPEVGIANKEKNFDVLWEKFIEGLYITRKVQCKVGHRKISLGIKNFLIKLGALKEVSILL